VISLTMPAWWFSCLWLLRCVSTDPLRAAKGDRSRLQLYSNTNLVASRDIRTIKQTSIVTYHCAVRSSMLAVQYACSLLTSFLHPASQAGTSLNSKVVAGLGQALIPEGEPSGPHVHGINRVPNARCLQPLTLCT